MTDPTTVNKLFAVPTRGSDSGTWDVPVNGNSNAIDGMLGGLLSIAVASTNVVLTAPSGITSPGPGPTQNQNALIRLTGALTGNVQVQITLPGFYIIENLCSNWASHVVQITSVGGGNAIGAPPGEKRHIFHDGTNIDFMDLPHVGAYWDLAATGVPNWVGACTVPPWLNCAGATFSGATYPVLAVYLGGTTLPDLRGRTRAFLNQGTGRITSGGSGVDGNTLTAAGGAQSQTLAQFNLPNVAFPVSDPGHVHGVGDPGHTHGYSDPQHLHSNAAAPNTNGTIAGSGQSAVGSSGNIWYGSPAQNTGNAAIGISIDGAFTGISIFNNSTGITVGSGGSNVPITTMNPVAISGITLIRAA